MWLKHIIIGISIGGGMVVPGISGGVLAVAFGIYEKMIKAILGLFKNMKENILFLGPLGIGILIGAIFFSRILLAFFNSYRTETCFSFIGLILGGLPILFRKINKTEDKKVNYKSLIIAFLISVILFILGKSTVDFSFSKYMSNNYISYLLLFLTGIIFISGKIIPGISSSFLMMLIGMYEYTLNMLAHPFSLSKGELYSLIPLTIGAGLGAVAFLKLMNYLLEKHHNLTYSAIIGFVIGSIAAIYPSVTSFLQFLVGLLFLIISFALSYLFTIKTNTEK